MRSSLLFSMFILAIIGAVLPGSIVHAETGTIIPLTWKDSGYELVPGYMQVVSLHAEAERNVLEYGFAPAALKIGNIVEVGYDATPPGYGGIGSMKIYFYVKINGEKVLWQEIDSLHYAEGKKAYETVVTLKLDCDGNIHITTEYGAWSAKTAPGEPIDLYEQVGIVDGKLMHLESKITYGEHTKIADCGDTSGDGDLPNPGDEITDEHPMHDVPWKWLGLAIVVLLIIILIKF